MSSFILNLLAAFKTMSGFSFLKHSRVFETKPTFPFLSLILNSKKSNFHSLQNIYTLEKDNYADLAHF